MERLSRSPSTPDWRCRQARPVPRTPRAGLGPSPRGAHAPDTHDGPGIGAIRQGRDGYGDRIDPAGLQELPGNPGGDVSVSLAWGQPKKEEELLRALGAKKEEDKKPKVAKTGVLPWRGANGFPRP